MSEEFKSHTNIGEFKEHPVITIFMEKYSKNDGSTGYNTFSFGKKKAQYIIKHIDEIKAFAEDRVPQPVDNNTDDDLPF